MKYRLIVKGTQFLGLLFFVATAMSQGWPREIPTSQGRLVLYQPQPQTVDGIKTSGVSAFSITPTGKKDPVFGALFYDAKLDIDRATRRYQVTSIQIPNIKFSGEQKDINLEKIKEAVVNEVPKWKLQGSMDELISTVEQVSDKASNKDLKNDPPKIVFTTKPSMLILIDGEPKLKDIDNTDLRYVQNTPYVIFQEKSSRKYFLYGGEIWYETLDVKGAWKTTKSVPKDILKLMEKNKDAAAKASTVKMTDKDQPPAIIVATEPTELIQTNGEPNYVPVKGSTELLYAKNSEDNLFKEISSNNYYILKSGRWFASKSTDGPWKYVPAEQIPADFSKIEQGAEKDIVRASIPGTDEARDAILDAQLPQTATVDRKTAGKDMKVDYDGAPKFTQIQGTSLQLAENANKTVMKSGSRYYVVDNGVWYESGNYNGPWEVSTQRPADVDNIPASSPAYNTRYVQIYDATPTVVYVGYTPGYMGSYVYGPTVVYGTGWYYRPWIGSWYYPYQGTWGFNMNYNPWTGWGIGFGYSNGPFHFGFGTGGFSVGFSWGFGMGYPMYGFGGGWFGPPMYRPPCFAPSYPWYGYNRPGYNYNRPNRPNVNSPGGGNINWGGGNQINIGGDVNININAPGGMSNNNLYNKAGSNKGISTGFKNADMSKVNVAQPGRQPVTGGAAGNARPAPGAQQPSRPAATGKLPETSKLPNDVFADKDGNVYRRDDKGEWKQNNGKDWARPSNMPAVDKGMQSRPEARPVQMPTRPSDYSRPSMPSTSEYDRNRATQRVGSYPAARPQPTQRAPVATPKAPTARPVPGKSRAGF